MSERSLIAIDTKSKGIIVVFAYRMKKLDCLTKLSAVHKIVISLHSRRHGRTSHG